MNNTYNEPQRSIGWFRTRLGMFTGSNISKLMGNGRYGAFSQTAMSYIYQVAAERNINEIIKNDDDLLAEYIEQTSCETKAMRFGMEMEDTARRLFAREYGFEIKEVGSIRCSSCETLAASPDGVFEYEEGAATLEIKCPTLSNYQKYRMTVNDADTLKEIAPEYYWQVMAEMLCTGADTAFIVFYNPYHRKPMHVVRLSKDGEAMMRVCERVRIAEEFIINNNQ